MNPLLEAQALSVSYGDGDIVRDVDLAIPDGGFTTIVGPNACGKSTLLRALARLLPPSQGRVLLDGQPISSLPSRQMARRLALLPQAQTMPEGLRVRDLVARGRFPHQSFFRRWSDDDERAVARALAVTSTSAIADRLVDELSGGQRQRAWIATLLAQDTPIVLLDEPTTFLDLTHQIEVLELCASLQRDGRTVVAVLHDLGLAARYATHMVAMKEGRISAQGTPAEVITPEIMRDTFGLACLVVDDPVTGTPLVVPERPVAAA
ncbi:MAG: ABC transporter ATP-binding protein [Propionibacteriaceae bacterium]|nr:ABC transporter ATP-binding protein [Propionibacteriaceae bacterium]